MNIDFDAIPKTLKGEPIRKHVTGPEVVSLLESFVNQGPSVPVRDVASALNSALAALAASRPEETLADICYVLVLNGKKAQEGTGPQKRACGNIAAKIANGGIVELGEEDVASIIEELEAQPAIILMACEALLKTEAKEPQAEAAE
jgi:hypothetical protein